LISVVFTELVQGFEANPGLQSQTVGSGVWALADVATNDAATTAARKLSIRRVRIV
jgi:hypothetical protein